VTFAKRKRLSSTIAIAIAVAVGAFAAGRWIPRGDRPANTAAPVSPLQSADRPAPTVSQSERTVARALDSVQREAIRSVVRDEVDAALGERDAAQAAAAAEVPPPAERAPASPSAEAAAADARARVEAARLSRRWTREDAEALRSAIAKMNASERDEILSAFVSAVNRGEIQPDQAGFLF
jgi:hypothetical protein